ncbi:hypothetical protein C8J56DRAFT_103679 [Mycena floridula]|nr:hypothetical protein C8J56DRAFT_103679 [Mycena floridula]
MSFQSGSLALLARLRENRIPYLGEVENIRSVVEETQAELDDVQDEMMNLETRLSALKKREEVLKQSLGEQRSLISPIRRLPVEIISMIFVEACNCDDPLEWVHEGVARTPFVLATTCRYWRTIVLDIGAVWSTIRMRLDNAPVSAMVDEIDSVDSDALTLAKLDMLDMFVLRSQDRPLKMSLLSYSPPCPQLARAVSALCDRISHLDTSGAVAHGLAGQFSQLEDLAITYHVVRNEPNRPFTFRWRKSVTGLKRLTLASKVSLNLHQYFWNDLYKGDIEFISIDDCAIETLPQSFFVHFPSLVEASIEFVDSNSYHWPRAYRLDARKPWKSTKSTRLRKLTVVSKVQTTALEEILLSVTCPALEELTLASHDVFTLQSWCHDKFMAFAQRSELQHTLTTLVLDGIPVAEDQLIEIFGLLTLVTRVGILENVEPFVILTPECIERLTHGSVEKPMLLPRLESMQVALRHDVSNPQRFNAMAQLVIARSTCGLEDVWLKFSHVDVELVEERFFSLVVGLGVRVGGSELDWQELDDSASDSSYEESVRETSPESSRASSPDFDSQD